MALGGVYCPSNRKDLICLIVSHEATQYTFIREIPMSMPYEVQLCTVGWDNKWVRNLSLKTKNLTGVT
jgi:hypothetical protein